jgi:hypothetical protein
MSIPRIVSQPQGKGQVEKSDVLLNIVGIFFGVEKQYLLLLVYEHILVGGLEHFLFSNSYMGCHPYH